MHQDPRRRARTIAVAALLATATAGATIAGLTAANADEATPAPPKSGFKLFKPPDPADRPDPDPNVIGIGFMAPGHDPDPDPPAFAKFSEEELDKLFDQFNNGEFIQYGEPEFPELSAAEEAEFQVASARAGGEMRRHLDEACRSAGYFGLDGGTGGSSTSARNPDGVVGGTMWGECLLSERQPPEGPPAG